MDVVCVGDCGIDLYRPAGELRVGGITANFARHARREFARDDRIRIVSCVGDDEDGDRVLSSFEGSGIDCHVRRLSGRTPVQTIEIRADGEKDFIAYDEGVLRDFSFSAADRQLIAAGDLLVAPVYLQIVGLFGDLMGIDTVGRVAVDFADFLEYPDFGLLEMHIERIDIAFFGLSPIDTAMIDRIAELADRHRKMFVVTMGSGGSVAFEGANRYACAAAPVDAVVDTTGAGDAYAAGFLSRYCRGEGVQASMRHGADVASSVVGQVGSFPAP
ncbi:MAG TPA: PfkB family carbohydrate kinase [Afifellaceae bacterium]|nr:PfkB family carbohydrate kinase [Afifellaceae bacterium]